MSKDNEWPTIGYIKSGDRGDYMSLAKDVKAKLNGEKIDLKYINIEEVLTVYDKETKTSTPIGKIVKTEKNGKKSTFISFNDNIEFGQNGSKIASSGIGFLQSKNARLQQLDNAVSDNKISEENADKIREAISYSKYQVVLPPPRD
jgi:ethanolamine utilization cobalamin adenosyltransferase